MAVTGHVWWRDLSSLVLLLILGFISRTSSQNVPSLTGNKCAADGIILSEDFTSITTSSERWSTMTGTIGTACGILADGNAAFFTGSGTTRELMTKGLDLTKATMMSFQYGRGSCAYFSSTYRIQVQYTIGDGGPFTTFSYLYPGSYTSTTANLAIPSAARSTNVKIKIYQPSFTANRYSWGIDNIVILYSSTHGFYDGFSSYFTNCNWFMPSGTAGAGCGSVGSVLTLAPASSTSSTTSSARIMSTRYFQTTCSDPACGRTLMFDLRMLCQGAASATTDQLSTVIRVEIRGVTSTRYQYVDLIASNYPVWRHYGMQITSSATVKVVFTQTGGPLATTSWAIDNFYQGSGCTTFCGGRGYCSSTGTCQCDQGYTGADCGTATGSFTSSLVDNFDTTVLASSPNWYSALGVTVGATCHVISDGKAAIFNTGTVRHLETPDMRLSTGSTISFMFKYGSSPCAGPSSTTYQVYLQYSLNAGNSWSQLAYFYYRSYLSSPSFNRFTIPSAALNVPVRFRFYQKSRGNNLDIAIIDNLYIGGQAVNATTVPFLLDFETAPTSTQVPVSVHSSIGKYCSSSSNAFVFKPSSAAATNYPAFFLTPPLNLPAGVDSMIQFNIYMGPCGVTSTALSYIQLLYSQGSSSRFSTLTVYAAQDVGNYWHRVSVLLKASTFAGKQFTFQIAQKEIETTVTSGLYWAIDNLYIGQSCPNRCSGHGVCQKSFTCNCDTGYIGADCSNVTVQNPTYISESFSSSSLSPNLRPPVGMQVTSSQCGPSIASGSYLSGFMRSYVRKLETVDLDVTSIAPQLTFRFQNGYGSFGTSSSTCPNPTSSSYQVNVQYSTNGGNDWVRISYLYYSSYRQGQDLVLNIPVAARTKATRFRWYQGNGGSTSVTQYAANRNVWSIDNILIGVANPNANNGSVFSDTFSSFTGAKWSRLAGAVAKPFCSNPAGNGNALVVSSTYSNSQGTQRYAYTNVFSLLLEPVKGVTYDFNKIPTGWQVSGGLLSQTCGMTSSAIIFSAPGSRYITSAPIDTRAASIIRFMITQGSASCDGPDNAAENVILEYSVGGGPFTLMATYPYNATQVLVARTVFVPLPQAAIASSVQFKWSQASNSGGRLDMWGIDTVLIEQLLNNVQYFMQFDMLPSCPGTSSSTSSYPILLQWANRTSGASSAQSAWQQVLQTCNGQSRPTGCVSNMYSEGSTYAANDNRGWRRVTIPLSITYRVAKYVQFRWSQAAFSSTTSSWAIDNVYIGWECPEMCSGHGRCVAGTCQCDTGFGGSACKATAQFPTELKDNFKAGFDPSKWLSWVGNTSDTTGRCGPLQGAYSILFSEAGTREAVTIDLDTTDVKQVEFVIRMGSYSSSTTCQRPDNAGETVVVQYSDNGGVQWVNLWTTTCTTCWDKNPTQSIVAALPAAAKTNATRFRWWQPANSGKTQDEWRLGNVFIGGKSNNSVLLYDDFDPAVHDGNWLFHPNGELKKGACFGNQSNNALVFTMSDGARLLYTRELNVSNDTFIQFNFYLSCGDLFLSDNYDVRLQYSVNRGVTWVDLGPPCTSSSSTSCVTGQVQSSYLRAGAYDYRTNVTFNVPTAAISPYTRFRWYQAITTGHSWGIDNVFIGSGCTNACQGHGTCRPSGTGVECSCYSGYSGADCSIPHVPAFTNFTEEFDNDPVEPRWTRVIGHTRSSNCGSISNGKALYFYKAGLRTAETNDINTTIILEVKFAIVIGSTSTSSTTCRRSSYTGNSVLLQYSTDGSITWKTIATYSQNTYTARVVTATIPRGARTTHTRFRWIQPYNQGNNLNQWAIDGISMREAVITYNIYSDFSTAIQDKLATVQNGGVSPSGYCSQKPALTFTAGSTPRYFRTVKLDLGGKVVGNTVVQFYLNMGCGTSFSTSLTNRIILQYRIGTGSDTLVVPNCLISPTNCASGLSGGPGSQYYWQAYSTWRRVTVMLPSQALVGSVAFKLTSSSSYPWAVRNLYIGSCPGGCSGHGDCTAQGTCKCDSGWSGSSCATAPSTLLTGFSDQFETINKIYWPVIVGGVSGTTCSPVQSGRSLTFYSSTLRYAETLDVDLRYVTSINFYLRIGSTSGSCETADSLNEGVLLSYSTTGGMTWVNFRTYSHTAYRSTRYVSYATSAMPAAMRVNGVRLRFWQPTNSGVSFDYWAIDAFQIQSASKPVPTISNVMDNFTSSAVSASYWVNSAGRTTASCFRSQIWAFNSKSTASNMTSAPIDLTASTGSSAPVLQFMINPGCGSTAASPINVQYRQRTGGFSLVRQQTFSASGTTVDMQASTYRYQPNTQYQWITLIFPAIASSNNPVTVSFTQTQSSSAVTWAVDNVYIGTTCPSACNGHGQCMTTGICSCWSGFTGNACQNPPQLPNDVVETFTSSYTKYFSLSFGAAVGTNCGTLLSGSAMVFVKSGLRQAVSVDFDTSKATTLSFYFVIGGACENADSQAEGVVLQYSNNGGISWLTLQKLGYTQRTAIKISIPLPSGAKTTATRFRWWQGSHSGAGTDGWAIDQFILTTPVNHPTELYDNFSDPVISRKQFTFSAGYIFNATSCATDPTAFGQTVQFSSKAGQSITTQDLNTDYADALIQFEIRIGPCDYVVQGANITLQYSLDKGSTFRTVVPGCKIGDTSCVGGSTNYQWASEYFSSVYQRWGRVTLLLPAAARANQVRFRWLQSGGIFSWNIDNIYVGSNCSMGCNNRGRCQPNNMCQCDSTASGANCSQLTSALPTTFLDTFEDDIQSGIYWESASGYTFGSQCGTLFEKRSAAFILDNTDRRQATTRDYDTRNADVLTFFFRIGGSGSCDSAEINEDVAIQASTDGGITWQNWRLLKYNQFPYVPLVPGQVELTLPSRYRTQATRFRFWQTTFSGANYDVWAVDEVYLGPAKLPLPSQLSDNFDTSISTQWLWYPGGNRTSQTNASGCNSAPGEAMEFNTGADGMFHFIETEPMALAKNSVVMFDLFILCGSEVLSTASTILYPIQVTMTANNDSNYKLLQGEDCVSSTPSASCPLGAGLPSEYFGYDNAFKSAKRIVIPIPAGASNARIRIGATYLATASVPQFAVDNVYIGPACPSQCSGHGTCLNGVCTCDAGFTNNECSTSLAGRLTSLQETFETGTLSPTRWSLVQGGNIVTATSTVSCGVIVSGNSLYFNGAGIRQAVTVDLDTRASLYLLFYPRLGSTSSAAACDASSAVSNRILAQFSIDGGATWTTLVTVASAASAQRVYNQTLPAAALSANTRFRIYQPHIQSVYQNEWAIDNVMVVGKVVALQGLSENFDPIITAQWSGTQNGTVTSFCGSTGSALVYEQYSTATNFTSTSATTVAVRPSLPVIVQFSLAFDCNLASTSLSLFNAQGSTSYVSLQYSNDGVTWKWVNPNCKPSGASTQGIPVCSTAAMETPSAWFFQPSTSGLAWKRITVKISDSQITGLTQFRWQSGVVASLPVNKIARLNMKFAIDNVAITRSCPNACRGHGTCTSAGSCVCDAGFNGTDCSPAQPLPMVLIDDFETVSSIWLETSGATRISLGCATTLSSAPSFSGFRLHFGHVGRRRATTVDMDTRFATQFKFSFLPTTGHCQLKTSFSNIYVQYSADGGFTFFNLQTITNQVTTRAAVVDRTISVSIPAPARGVAVRFRLWQPDHDDNNDAFEIDNVVIGGICTTSPCKNGATCLETSPSAYTCVCTSAYTGTVCDTPRNACLAKPCLNGATCTADLATASYTCACPGNFTGSVCQFYKFGCTNSPCMNGATCFDFNSPPTVYTSSCFGRCGQPSVGSVCRCDPSCKALGVCCANYTSVCETPTLTNQFSCLCAAGYTGTQCNVAIDACQSSPCVHGACVTAINNYTCTCQAGYTGPTCSVEINECQSNPCRNGATCVDLLARYTCRCVNGWSGPRCQTNANNCAARPCRNGATCIDGLGTYTCLCAAGFTGSNCSADINECLASTSPCKNGATCVNTLGSYSCLCPPAYTGVACQTHMNLCSTLRGSYCLNGGVCSQVGLVVSCNCNNTGYYGTQCQFKNNYCQPNPCLFGAACTSLAGTYSCQCPAWKTGINCQTDLDECISTPCANNGTCVDGVNRYDCVCPAGFTGPNCIVQALSCVGQVCANGGTCYNYNSTLLQCACPPAFTGPFCTNITNMCDSMPCQNGGTCIRGITGFDYNCSCPLGWMGKNCSQKEDFCKTQSCMNGGTCTNTAVGSQCKCATGYSGLRCELNTDDCVGVMCFNGGTCNDELNNFTCNCTEAFTNRYCQTPIQYCLSTPCQNNGTCYDLIGAYRCQCTSAYDGVNCQKRRSPCLSGPCAIGATCVWNGVSTKYECQCPPDFTGPRCRSKINNCQFDSCFNSGICVDGIDNFTCSCPPGFTGRHCQTNINDCALSTTICLNGASCVDGINSYTCTCAAGFTGTMCQTNINNCANVTCQHNGTCMDLIADFKCLCTSDFTGPICETEIYKCSNTSCRNGATCVPKQNSFVCNCVAGFTGAACQTNINDCTPGICNTGTCADGINQYNCTCPVGFTGSNCQTNIDDCVLHNCTNGATCVDGINSYTCFCAAGFTGSACTVNINDCKLVTCLNGGQCIDGVNTYHCQCPLGFTGHFCQTNIDDCPTANCQNGATCVDGIAAYTCTCSVGFTGKVCESKIDYCAAVNCSNGASCVSGSTGFVCACTQGFTGLTCQTNIDDCARTKCSNGATCVDGIAAYTCNCAAGFTGQMCQTNIDDCVNSTCFNAATCVDGINQYSCICVAGFTGQWCQTNINECVANNCQNGATCVDGINAYSCNCAAGFTGFMCQTNINDCATATCMNGATCVDGIAEYTCTCSAGFTGAMCQTNINDCATATCHNGATCVDGIAAYTCVCTPGFTGAMCQTNIDDCVNATCLNGATCIDGVQTYTCGCVAGFTGISCQTNINECATVSCLHGGTCIDGLNTYKCQCTAGYTGPVCADVSHKCTVSSCHNGATCVDSTTGGSYTCTCLAGFTGLACQTNINECLVNNCLNDATCIDGVDAFTCACVSGFTGVTCQTNINDCVSNNCINGATCVDGITAYTCSCAAGFTGQMCQTNIDDCATATCQNGASCVDGINTYTCVCAGGFTGQQCEVNIDDCAGVTCQNSGTCVDGVSSYTCSCATGFTGAACQTNIDNCPGVNCQNGGTCVDGIDSYRCACSAGFTGAMCQTNINDCETNACYGHGTCVDGIASFTCTCNAGYTGVRCQTNIDNCANKPCANGATCVDQVNAYTCQCVSGFTGTQCETNINDCTPTACMNGGTCIDGVATFTCSCPSTHTGQTCQTKNNFCAGSPCHNGATCVDGIATYTCQCQTGFTGQMCQSKINFCAGVACQNGATCVSGATAYRCVCAAGYSGMMCQTRINNCAGVSCQNGATCVNGLTSYTCQCVAGFTGTMCQTNINNCLASACFNGGRCVDGVQTYSCQCLSGFSGTRCETNIDDCVGVTCQNGGTCVDGVNKYTCVCPAGFTARQCQTNINDCAGVTCQNGGSCVDGINAYTCSCAAGFTGTMCQTNINNCPAGACFNGGRCVDGVQTYSCQCLSGFSGTRCETNIDDCVGVTCQNGGTCVDGVNKYTCVCPAGFTARQCQTNINDCAGVTCQNSGSCVDGINAYTCSCAAGFTGRQCQTAINFCQNHQCAHGSACVGSNSGYTCTCLAGYTGRFCQTNINDCTASTCNNGGTCVDGINSFTCQCPAFFTGLTCAVAVNPCAEVDCGENGACERGKCVCKAGWSGSKCQTSIDTCQSLNCANGGSCHEKSYGFACTCTPGWTGRRCVDATCANKECNRPYGFCKLIDNNTTALCNCLESYTGPLCQTPPSNNNNGNSEGQTNASSVPIWAIIVGVVGGLLVLVILVVIVLVVGRKRKVYVVGADGTNQVQYANPLYDAQQRSENLDDALNHQKQTRTSTSSRKPILEDVEYEEDMPDYEEMDPENMMTIN